MKTEVLSIRVSKEMKEAFSAFCEGSPPSAVFANMFRKAIKEKLADKNEAVKKALADIEKYLESGSKIEEYESILHERSRLSNREHRLMLDIERKAFLVDR